MDHSGHFVSSTVGDELTLLRSVLDHLPVGISIFDAQLQLLAANRLLLDWLDFPPHLFDGRLPGLEELTRYNAQRGEYGPGDPEEQTRQRMALARQGQAHRFLRQRPSGRVLEIVGEPLPGGGFISLYVDVTEHQRTEAALQEKALYLKSVVDHLPQGISVFDQHLQLKSWNSTLLDVLGLPAHSVYDNVPFEDLIMFPAKRGEYGPGDPAEQVAQRRALALQFQPHRFERKRPNGHTHLVEGRPMLMDGETVGFVTSYTDITEGRQREAALAEKTTLLQTLVDNMPSGVTVFDAQLRLVLANQKAFELLDFSRKTLQEHPDFESLLRWNVLRGEYGDVDVDSFVAAMVAKAVTPVAHRLERIRPNGTVVELRGAPMPHGGFVTIYTDVTEQKNIEKELRHQSEVFQTLVDNIPGGVTLFGADQRLLAHNKEYARLLEFPDELFNGQPTLEVFFRYNAQRGEYGPGDVEEQVRERLRRAAEHTPHQFKRMRPNGTMLDVRGLPLADGSFVTIYTDVTEQHRAAEAIARLAHRDTLTGLANRYTLEARLDQLVADARRHGRRLAVMFLDMDNFKAINDTLGHAVGDQFLCAVAKRVADTVRDNDIVARLGGDEFVVVLAEVPDTRLVTHIAQKIIDTLRQPTVVGPHTLRASASMGICLYPQDGDSRGALMQSADIAMYHAKKAGKSTYHFFDADMMAKAAARLEVERALREAVELHAFELHYQPVMEKSGQKPIGVEALIRWRRTDCTLVSPLTFIPLAEEIGLIDDIGHWALEQACRTLARWHRAGLPGLCMAVNLSAVQLRNPELGPQLSRILQSTGLPGSALTLEITESVAMQDPQASILRLGAIRLLGVRLAIDDFGTGYSSLAYLKRLPLNYLKLDRTFVEDVESDANDAAICAATIGLAHALGLSVVAEGVETAGQHHFLARLGCDSYQGYFFSHPVPEDEALKWLLQRTV